MTGYKRTGFVIFDRVFVLSLDGFDACNGFTMWSMTLVDDGMVVMMCDGGV